MAETETESAKPQSKYTAKYWQDQLGYYRQAIETKWSDQRKNLDKLYSRDERADSADREYAIFWANIEVLKPAVYAKPPQPAVVPRFKDGNLIARAASETVERCLVTTFDQSDIDGCMREVRDEFLRYARGSARARLATRNGSPCVEFDHFTAADFAHGVARTWREVPWVGFRSWLNLEKGVARFGEVFRQVPRKKRDQNAAVNDPEDQAPVWEIWCKDSGQVHFIAEDFDRPLDETEPWLDLSGFWPCPRPAYGTVVPGKLMPVPDIRQYKDQIEEINEYTARIAALSQSLRLKGFYPAGAGEISEAIEAAIKDLDNRTVLVPVSSFAALGGSSFKDSIVWLPVDQIAVLIKELVELRRVLIDDVYQITGISDIVRGQTEASETATAQQLKAQWGSIRIRERQNELARFARDMTRIAGEIIAENFDGKTIAEMSQVQLPTLAQKQQLQIQMQQAQQMQAAGQPVPPIPAKAKQTVESPAFEEVLQFLANDKARGFLIDIETDSTIQPNEDAEKQRRTEFVTAVGGFIAQAFPMVKEAPQLGNFVGETLKFVAQGFRAGRPLEGAIDQLVAQIEEIASQPPAPPQPDPTEQVKLQTAQVKGQAEEFKAKADMAQTQMDMQQSALEHHQSMREMEMQAMMPPQQVPVQ
ncbi:hypothetical protein [Bradyrhizobium sp. USDA 3458]|uniref:hypothetical protein n=1 Tax=Bradyrhizobium sp. USDA 3458 TaxID=2591461 RepID=UPI001143BC53|nr:hypothetical protein [Bradyrhizobium sp. USDA 3458]